MALSLFVRLLVVCLLLALALLGCLDRLPLRPSSPKGAAKRSSLPVLATGGIRRPESACENFSSCFLLLDDSSEEIYHVAIANWL